MHLKYIGIVVVTCVWFLSAQFPAHSQSVSAFDPGLASNLQEALTQEFERQNLRGISAAVFLPGEGIWRGVAGKSGDGALDLMADSIHFAVASITKTFTGALILQLAEEGRLNLDDSLHQWLPAYQYINLDITLRQLLGHTSGLYNITDNPDFWTAFWADPARNWTPEEILTQFMMRPVLQPGRAFDYSNSNYHLLGMVARAVTDSSMVSLMRRRLYNPQLLQHTFFTPEEPVDGMISDNWSDADRDGHFENVASKSNTAYYSMSWAAGGMTATASDMAVWAQALFAGNVLREETRDEMLAFTPLNNGTAFTGYGLGIMRFEFDGVEMWGHTGLKPGFLSMLVYVPASGVSICVLINQDNAASTYAVVPKLYTVLANPVSTDISDGLQHDREIVLSQHFPNPVRSSTTFTFELATAASVSLEVFDVRGALVETVTQAFFPAGQHRVSWQPQGLAGGVYFYRLKSNQHMVTRPLVYLQ